MKTIAFLFAAAVALGASMPGAQAAPVAAQTQGIQAGHAAQHAADEISAQHRHHSTHRHHPHSRPHHHSHRHNWHHSHRHNNWHRSHRHCRQVWHHGRWTTVCR